MSLKELGETILTLQNSTQSPAQFSLLTKSQADTFTKVFLHLLAQLQNVDSTDLSEHEVSQIIENIFAVSQKYFGPEGIPFTLGFFVSAIGLGPTLKELQTNISPDRARAVICYFVKHPELYKQLTDTLV